MRLFSKNICSLSVVIIMITTSLHAQETTSQLVGSMAYDFGVISEDTPVVNGVIQLSNLTSDDMTIKHAAVSCSCVEASISDSLIAPENNVTIYFSFRPKDFPGVIDKQIYIYTIENGSERTLTINLTGEVTPSTDPTRTYRYSMGNLWMKQKQVSFTASSHAQVEKISCYNNSADSMLISVSDGNLPQGISFTTHPNPIQPHSSGELIFSFNPNLWCTNAPVVVTAILNGIDSAAETQHSIQIKIED